MKNFPIERATGHVRKNVLDLFLMQLYILSTCRLNESLDANKIQGINPFYGLVLIDPI
jgi:hypothetical protein